MFLFVVFLLPKLLKFFLPFVIAIVISAIANPMVKFLEKRVKIVRKAGSVIIIVLVLAAVIGLLWGLIAFIYNEVTGLLEDTQSLQNQLNGIIDSFTEKLKSVMNTLPFKNTEETDQSAFDPIRDYINNLNVADLLGKLNLSSLKGGFSGTADVILIIIMSILAAYFMIAEHDNLINRLQNLVPKSLVDYFDMISYNFRRAVGGYIKVQLKLMLVIMFIIFVGFLLLKIDYAFLLALLIAFLDFLPVFGTGTVIWPWIVVDLINGNYTQAIFLFVIYIICQIVKQVLQPKMVGDSIGMNPLATLFFMYTGYKMGGFIGMIIGIPIGMILISLYEAGVFDQLIKGGKIIVRDVGNFKKF